MTQNFLPNPAPFYQILPGAQIPMRSDTTLYVGNLSPTVNDVMLFSIASRYGKVASSRVMKDRYNRDSREFGFITYNDLPSAIRAQKDLNFKVEYQRELRVYFKKDTKEFDKNANLIIKNLPKTVTSKMLNEQCQEFGEVYSCFAKSVERHNKIEYCGFGYVQFQKLESAEALQAHFEKNLFCGQQLLIQKHIPAILREKTLPRNLYIKDLPKGWTKERIEEFLAAEFGAFGEIESMSTYFYAAKQSFYCFVCYKSAEDAAKAVQAMNNKPIDDSKLFVRIAETKSQRQRNMALEMASNELFTNLYIRSLKPTVTIETITEVFSAYGPVTSVSLADHKKQNMKNPKEFAPPQEMKFAFVNFKDHNNAATCLMSAKTDKKIKELLVTDKDDQFISVFQPKNIRDSFKFMKRNMTHGAFGPKPYYNNGFPQNHHRKNRGPPFPANFPPQAQGMGMNMPMGLGMGMGFDGIMPTNSNPMSQQSITPTTPSKQQETVSGSTENYKEFAQNLRNNKAEFLSKSSEEQKNILGNLMYKRIFSIFKDEELIPKITGMLIDTEVLDFEEILEIIVEENALRERIDEAIEVINENNNNEEGEDKNH